MRFVDALALELKAQDPDYRVGVAKERAEMQEPGVAAHAAAYDKNIRRAYRKRARVKNPRMRKLAR